MSLWIKICGNTSLEDALLAAEAGADAVGFVFARSPRQVTTCYVEAMTAKLPQSVEKIGVFVDATLAEIEVAVLDGGLTGVQLHFSGSPDLPEKLRERFGLDLRILRVLHFSPCAVLEAASFAADRNIDALLVDSRTETTVGGTGIAFDWNSAVGLFQNSEERPHLVLAGGLTPENVPNAITTLHPWGIDVASGVESAPGRKDAEKVRKFIARARAISEPGQ
ncbi:MAG: phosphoribosylanthranilate isomerase [Terracidiphilus sp.]